MSLIQRTIRDGSRYPYYTLTVDNVKGALDEVLGRISSAMSDREELMLIMRHRAICDYVTKNGITKPANLYAWKEDLVRAMSRKYPGVRM